MSGIKRLFWDIETSPNIHYSWKAGSKIFLSHDSILKERTIICIGYKWQHEKRSHCITWNYWDDKELIQEFTTIANQADELVAHYGDKFDLKWFKGRNLIHGLPPLPDYKTVDTYKIASKHFYLNSYKLDYLAYILTGKRKIKTDYDLWKSVCNDNNPKSLAKMAKYCKMDAYLVQSVWEELSAYQVPSVHSGVLSGLDRWTCPHCSSEEVILSKTRSTSKGIIQRQMQCSSCHRYYTVSDPVYAKCLMAKSREVCNV